MKIHLLSLFIAVFILAITISATSKKDDPKAAATSSLSLHFENVVDGQKLLLEENSPVYKNANGEDFKINTFKFYISNVNLIDDNGKAHAIPDSYILVNAADSASLRQTIPSIPTGTYKGINFTIGVDSLRNFAGAQTGCLDPANGMFWSWNSGYIFVKFEGESAFSNAKNRTLTFHIGGAKAPNNTIRRFTQKFNDPLKIESGKQPEIDITVNAAALFKGKTIVSFSKINFTMGGPNSVVVADNYADGLFKVAGIKN